MTKNEVILKIEQILKAMIGGKRSYELITIEDIPEDMVGFIEIFNKFIGDIVECQGFIDSLASGNLDAETPSRGNYASGSLKELHSQLISMSVNIKDLSEGKIVSKLYYPGELFENYNSLIATVSNLMNDENNNSTQGVSSWKYHQVLSAINQLNTMVVQYDNAGQLIFANLTAQKKLTGIDNLPKVDKPIENDLHSYLGKFTNIIKRMKHHEVFGSRFPVIVEIQDKKNDTWYSVHTDVAKLTDGTIGVIHMIDDITQWKYTEQELKNEASYDPLTSAYTRKVGNKKLQEMINLRKTQDNCVGFVDMDDLKRINDNYGHIEGDFAIKTVATILMSTVRDTDWVIRYGGDEFLILFENCTEEDAEKSIDRMYDQLEDLSKSIDKPYKIQFSIGHMYINEDMSSIQQVIDSVDEKMYQNKLERKQKLKSN